jgi:NMD protein affecting ribosome stability and mRNA decay
MKTRDPRHRQRRHVDRQLEDVIDDPYQARRKPAGPALCPGCGAVFRRGRWSWAAAPRNATQHACPACRRIAERNPAGYVRLSGAFLAGHRHEVLGLVRNEEAREKRSHPLQRIMTLRETDKAVEIATTDVHLARRLGQALRSAFRGDLEVKTSRDERLVRVRWTR